MKKGIVLSGVLVCLSGVANAANVIDGNPFYNPKQGHYYNILTPFQVNSKFDKFVMADEFGYGVSDSFAIYTSTSGSYDSSDNPEFGKWAWNDLEFGYDWNLWEKDGRIAETYGAVKQIYSTRHGLQTVAYNWTTGARVGRVTEDWSLAGIVQVDYLNDDLPEDTFDSWAMGVGVKGQYVLNSRWNIVGGMMFDFDLFGTYYDGERLMIDLGVNYNLDETKYMGFYVKKDIVHSFEHSPATMGVLVGIDF